LASAQTINLDFEPKGQIIKFCIENLTVYSDTTSVFYVYDNCGAKGFEEYDLKVKRYISQNLPKRKGDTITFTGNFIPLNDNFTNQNQKDWAIDWVILQLTKQKRIKIYDSHGQVVRQITTKRIGTKKEGHVRRAFINKETKEELFSELIFLRVKHIRYRH
jgi:hypothetical protein